MMLHYIRVNLSMDSIDTSVMRLILSISLLQFFFNTYSRKLQVTPGVHASAASIFSVARLGKKAAQFELILLQFVRETAESADIF